MKSLKQIIFTFVLQTCFVQQGELIDIKLSHASNQGNDMQTPTWRRILTPADWLQGCVNHCGLGPTEMEKGKNEENALSD